MTAWRRIACFVSLGVGLVAGCTVTTNSNSNDGGVWDTGGTSGTGGTGATGGTDAVGGSTANATTILACDPTAEQPGSCGECIQKTEPEGMCTDYLVCANVEGCIPIINSMVNCMASKADSSGIIADPVAADAECRPVAGIPSDADTGATGAADAARTFWNQISQGFICSTECWAV